MISDFEEKEIRNAILNKINPAVKKSGKHWKGSIILGGKLIAKVKIPNSHNRIMHESKSQYIAESLRLSDDQFNRFVECTLRGPEYFQIQTEIETLSKKN